MVLTKEMIVLRPTQAAHFDSFFLLWALTLRLVRNQWERVVFMQASREDVGKRFYEIELPFTEDANLAQEASEAFRRYYLDVAEARAKMAAYLSESDRHHFFVSGGEPPDAGDAADIAEEAALADEVA